MEEKEEVEDVSEWSWTNPRPTTHWKEVFACLRNHQPFTTTLKEYNHSFANDEEVCFFFDCIELSSESSWNLRLLDLSCGGITAVGARRIGRFLATNPQLRQLYLQHNRIDDEGACSLFDNIHHNTNLLTLDLSDNLVTPQEISTFEEQMRTSPNTTLTVLFSDSASDLLQCFDGDICRSRRSNVLLELR